MFIITGTVSTLAGDSLSKSQIHLQKVSDSCTRIFIFADKYIKFSTLSALQVTVNNLTAKDCKIIIGTVNTINSSTFFF